MKKLLAILLALTLALTLVPTLAFAQNEDGAEPDEAIVEESKETPKEAPEGEAKEESKEEPKEEPQENPEGKTEGETKEEGKGEIKDTGDVQAAPLLTATDDPICLTNQNVNQYVEEVRTQDVLKPGNYYLGGSLALRSNDFVIKGDVTIDLRGCNITFSNTLTISSTGRLTLKNSNKDSGGIRNVVDSQGWGFVFLYVDGTFIMDDGARISGVDVHRYAISVGSAGKLIMNEGSSIKNCKADSGVVDVDGTFIMNGGSIANNKNDDDSLITAVNGNGRFYQYGGAIDGPVQGAAIKWDDTENAYLIYTADGLKAFRDMVNNSGDENSVCAILINDIDLNDEQWTPIEGYAINTFDGGGHTISGLYVTGKEYAGLFSHIWDYCTVKNVAVTGSVNGTEYAGGIAGIAHGGSIEGCVNLCRVSVVGGESYTSSVFAGGIVGQLGSIDSPPGSIKNCANWGAISASTQSGYSTYVGGIAGAVDAEKKSTIANCYSVGKVSGGAKSTDSIHGICPDTSSIKNSYYLTGTVVNDPTPFDSDRREKANFADGTVLALLRGKDPNSPWADKCGYLDAAKMTLPLLKWQQADDHTCNTDGVLGGCTCGLPPEGKGTAAAPYEIKTAEDLKAFRDLVNGGETNICGKLIYDITLNDGTFDENGNWSESDTPEQWTPIGTNDKPYTGTFNGNGKTVHGLYIITNRPGQTYIGLFGNVQGGTVKNVAVTGYVAASDNLPGAAGGIAGNVHGGTIEGCVNLCRVEAGISCAGGIAGIAIFSSTIKNCANLGEISTEFHDSDEAGGVVGALWYDSTMTGCYNAGRVTNGGGIAGNADDDKIVNSYYLTGTAEKAAITGNLDNAAAAKSKAEFADGTVRALLQNGDEESPWTKTGYLAAAKMTLPLLKWQTADEHTHDGAQWLSDATSHWKECTCGVIYDEDAHSGGTATSTTKARCEVCGAAYGQLASGGIRRQPTGGSGAANTSDTTKTVKSGNTGDAGIALYAGMALLSLTGGAWLRRKKH